MLEVPCLNFEDCLLHVSNPIKEPENKFSLQQFKDIYNVLYIKTSSSLKHKNKERGF